MCAIEAKKGEGSLQSRAHVLMLSATVSLLEKISQITLPVIGNLT